MELSREADDYLQRYQDVFANDYFRQNPLEHYNRYGQNEGRQWGGMMSGPPVNMLPHGEPPEPPPRPGLPPPQPFTGRPSQTPPGTGGGQGLAPVPSYQPPPVERERPSTPLQTPPGTGGLSPNPNWNTSEPGPRVPPGNFDPNMYLKLNPDVKSLGIDPYTHYVMFGMDEGRKYQIPSLFNPTPMGGGQAGMASQLAGQVGGQIPGMAQRLAGQVGGQMGGGQAGMAQRMAGQMGGGQATLWDLLQRLARYPGQRPAGG